MKTRLKQLSRLFQWRTKQLPVLLLSVAAAVLLVACAPFAEHSAGNAAPSAKGQAADGRDAIGAGKVSRMLYGPVAVLPLANISGTPAPLEKIRAAYIDELEQRGIAVLGEEALDDFMARHRYRDTSGIDGGTAKALQEETPAIGVLITTLESYQEEFPPKAALSCRLVSAGEMGAEIRWMDGTGLEGDDHPGFFDRGLVRDSDRLLHITLARIAESLTRHFAGEEPTMAEPAKRYAPKVMFKDEDFPRQRPLKAAIIPFLNNSDHKHGAAILQEHLLKYLSRDPRVQVLEPGTLRQVLYKYRMLMPVGMSRADAELIASDMPGVDLLITGIVEIYIDSRAAGDIPWVDFYLMATNRRGKVVWNSRSFNRGDEGVWFFDLGSVKSAYPLADHMTRAAAAAMLKPAIAEFRDRKVQ